MLKLSKILLNIFFVVLVIILSLVWLRKNDLFVINHVKVVGNNLLSKEEIVELADLDFTKEIFEIDTDMIRNRVAMNPLIEKVSVSRYLPSAIRINIVERDLLATIADREVIVLDADGRIVNTGKTVARYDLPIITGAHLVTDSTGHRFPAAIVNKMLKILKAVRLINLQLYHEISEINYGKDYGIMLYLRQNATPIIIGFDDYKEKVNNLSTIYDLLNNRGELTHLKSIDVRFNGQVVVRN